MHSYDYAIVRVVPRVERGEFVVRTRDDTEGGTVHRREIEGVGEAGEEIRFGQTHREHTASGQVAHRRQPKA